MPRCSVLLPVCNAAATLTETLDSIAAQSLADYELIAVDDHSSDESASLLQHRALSDPRIRLLENPGQGLVSALNYGLAEARCEYVARMDSDDLMRPERLRIQADHMDRRPTCSVVGSRVNIFGEQTIRAGYRQYQRWLNGLTQPEDLALNRYVESPLAHPAVMFRKSAVIDAGGYRDGPFPEDYELWLRLFASDQQLANADEVLLDWRDSPGRTSRTDPRYDRAAFDQLRADYLIRDPRIQAAENIEIWGAGKKSRQRVRRLVDHGAEISRWVDIDPKKIGRALWGKSVIPPTEMGPPKGGRKLVLVYVTNHGAREDISQFLTARGYRPGIDFLCVG